MNDTSGYKYIVAYGMAIALFVLVIKTKLGYKTMYYMLSLSLLVVVLSQSKFIASSLQPLTADLLNKPTIQ